MYVTIYEVYLNKTGRIDDFEEYVAPNGKKLHSIPEVLKWFDDLPRSIGDWGESVTVDFFGCTRTFMTLKGIEECNREIRLMAFFKLNRHL